jgi:ribosomal protein S18 acetylase RimI-like enzyme
VEILDLRHFAAPQLRPLLDEETLLWQNGLSWDYHGSAGMILRYSDNKVLPGYAAVENGRVIGYSFFVYEGSKGVIGDLYVETAQGTLRRRVAAELAGHVIDTLQNSPGTTRIEAQLLLPDAGWVSESFQLAGFRVHPRLFLHLPVGGENLTPRHRPEGFEIRPWNEKDYQPAAEIISAAYGGHIDAAINDQYRTRAGAMRFLNNIVRFPGCGYFDDTASFVAVDSLSGNRIGLLLCSRVSERAGHITQLCLLPSWRGCGLGETLICACHQSLRRRGFQAITLTVTEENRNAVALYERLGFQQKHRFDSFVWERP